MNRMGIYKDKRKAIRKFDSKMRAVSCFFTKDQIVMVNKLIELGYASSKSDLMRQALGDKFDEIRLKKKIMIVISDEEVEEIEF